MQIVGPENRPHCRFYSAMNTAILSLALTLTGAAVFAQGTVIFNNRITGTLVTRVYGPNPNNPSLSQAGNGPDDTPAGTTDWSGYTPLSGAGYSAQLWAAPGANPPLSPLQPATPMTTFRTGAAAGFLAGTTATLTGVPRDTRVATVTLRVWDNASGTIPTWQAALNSCCGYSRGESPEFALNSIGGQVNVSPVLQGLLSFNIHAPVPEPSALLLGPLAVALAVLLGGKRRQNKSTGAPEMSSTFEVPRYGPERPI
jgi:hypothetical protein